MNRIYDLFNWCKNTYIFNDITFFIQTPCKLLHVNTGHELSTLTGDLVNHFTNISCPVMMGELSFLFNFYIHLVGSLIILLDYNHLIKPYSLFLSTSISIALYRPSFIRKNFSSGKVSTKLFPSLIKGFKGQYNNSFSNLNMLVKNLIFFSSLLINGLFLLEFQRFLNELKTAVGCFLSQNLSKYVFSQITKIFFSSTSSHLSPPTSQIGPEKVFLS